MLRTKLLGMLAVIAAAVIVPGSAAARGSDPHRLVVKDAVTVGTDGNGATTASFGGAARADVRYVLAIENGCREPAATNPCPPPVNTLSVTLNEQVVFQADSPQDAHHARLPPDAVSATQDNRLTITAAGTPGSAARVRILATPPAPKDRLVVKDAVTVGTDGNGTTTASFGGAARADVRYVLAIENGCREPAATNPCPPPVNTLSVTLNEQVVFQADSPQDAHHARLPPDAVSATQDNRLTITAAGTPGSAARVRISERPRRSRTSG